MCGATIGWSYGRLFEPSIRTWLLYNASYVVALAVLGLVSMAVLEPRTTMAELFTLDGPPMDLIGDALPLAVAFTLGTDGGWTGSYSFMAGTFQYKFIVSGTQWIPDPTNPNTVPDGFGGTNSVYVCSPQ